MSAPCKIEMLGGLRAEQDGRSVTRFRTHKTAVLLAYLAFYLGKPHPRETLTELLWPECAPEAGRNSLSKALSSLRNQLEPPGVPVGAVILADRVSVQLNPQTCATDVGAFQAALRAAAKAGGDTPEALSRLAEAVELYKGELLPGFYEDWNLAERDRLADSYLAALRRLAEARQQSGDFEQAREFARRAVVADPLREEAHALLIRLCVDAGDAMGALRQYRELERVLEKDMGTQPDPSLQALIVPLAAQAALTRGEKSGARPMPRHASCQAAGAHAVRSPSANGTISSPAVSIPPSGTVTFLMAEGDDVASVAAIRQAVLREGGHEVPGDECVLIAAFGRASEAAAGVLAAWRALGKMGDAVRLALHTGEMAAPGDDTVPAGALLDEARRLLRAVPPGRSLCSEATAVLVRRDQEPGQQVLDLGFYRLAPQAPPERLFEIIPPGRISQAVAVPRAEPGFPNALPLQLTRFFGREAEVVRLTQALDGARPDLSERLWTLTGPGGMGKTRLSLEVARRLTPSYGGAVWFVPLAEITDVSLIAEAVADALGLPRMPGVDPLRQVAESLAGRPSLLVLDNFEQLVGPARSDEAADFVHTLMSGAPALTCLVTSRHRLGLLGEREFPLAPLAMPAGPDTPEALSRCESVRLFVDRAQAVRPDFQVTPGNAKAVALLCERLEGLPLAIELAAARAQVLTPAQMLTQLERRFDFLVSRQRNFALRHRTIRAAVDWSYDLLTPELRRFLGCLSVFRGGWSLAAAEAVCEEPLALDHLAQLVECSLVIADEGGDEVRFRQLETLREYADAMLSSEERAALRRRHAAFFLALAEEAEPELQGPAQTAWLSRLETEHDNFRAALHWCQAGSDPERVVVGLRLAAALWRFWHIRGYWTEGREGLAELLMRAEGQAVPAMVIGRARVAAGALARWQGDDAAARPLLEDGLARAWEADDATGAALALYHLGLLEMKRDKGIARRLFDENMVLCRQRGDRSGVASALTCLGILASEQGRFEEGRALFEEALALRRELDDRWGVATLLNNLGNVALFVQDHEAVRALFGEALALRRQLGDRWGVASALNSLGLHASEQGDYAAAGPLLEEGLVVFRELGDPHGIAGSLCNLGTVAFMLGEAAAQPMLTESLTLRWKLGDKLGVAYSLEGLARMVAGSRHPERAACLWGVAESLRESIGAPLPPSDRATVEQAAAAARAAMEESQFAAAWAHGRGLELEQALALALDDTE